MRLGPTTWPSHGSWLSPPVGRTGGVREREGHGECVGDRRRIMGEKEERGIKKEVGIEERHKPCFIILFNFIDHFYKHLPMQMLISNLTNRKLPPVRTTVRIEGANRGEEIRAHVT